MRNGVWQLVSRIMANVWYKVAREALVWFDSRDFMLLAIAKRLNLKTQILLFILSVR